MRREIKTFRWQISDGLQSSLSCDDLTMAQELISIRRPGWLALDVILYPGRLLKKEWYFPPVNDVTIRAIYFGKRKCQDPELRKAMQRNYKKGRGKR